MRYSVAHLGEGLKAPQGQKQKLKLKSGLLLYYMATYSMRDGDWLNLQKRLSFWLANELLKSDSFVVTDFLLAQHRRQTLSLTLYRPGSE